jgi:hypothetical protein
VVTTDRLNPDFEFVFPTRHAVDHAGPAGERQRMHLVNEAIALAPPAPR